MQRQKKVLINHEHISRFIRSKHLHIDTNNRKKSYFWATFNAKIMQYLDHSG